MRLIYLCLFWIVGIYLGSVALFPWGFILLAATAVLILILALRRRQALFLFGLCLIALSGGIALSQQAFSTIDEQVHQIYDNSDSIKVEAMEGVITADPEPGDRYTSLRLERVQIKVNGEWQELPGTAQVYAPRVPNFVAERDFPYYRYGDLLQVDGGLQLEKPEDYLIRQNIYSVVPIYNPQKIELVAAGQGSKPMEWIYSLRDNLSRALDSSLQEPENSLAQAILLGRRGTIPTELKSDLITTGTVHITAVSGLHVSIVAGILLSLGVWLFGRRRPTYFVLALIGVWLYAVLTGWRPPVFRAAIMGSLWLFAAYIGRPRSALTSLLLAAAIMVGIHPLLLWSASFQLSFAGVAGLVFLMPKFQDLGRKAFTTTREGSGWGASSARFAIDTLSVTLAAILFTLPLIAYYFGYISVVGLPTSFFILPAVPSIIVASALTGIIGLFLLPLAQILGWVAWLFSAYVIGVVELFSALPFAACNISVNIAMIVAYYLVLALAIWLSGNWKKLKRPLPEWKST